MIKSIDERTRATLHSPSLSDWNPSQFASAMEHHTSTSLIYLVLRVTIVLKVVLVGSEYIASDSLPAVDSLVQYNGVAIRGSLLMVLLYQPCSQQSNLLDAAMGCTFSPTFIRRRVMLIDVKIFIRFVLVVINLD